MLRAYSIEIKRDARGAKNPTTHHPLPVTVYTRQRVLYCCILLYSCTNASETPEVRANERRVNGMYRQRFLATRESISFVLVWWSLDILIIQFICATLPEGRKNKISLFNNLSFAISQILIQSFNLELFKNSI